MHLRVRFSVRISVWALRAAGLITDAYHPLFHKVVSRKASLPAQIVCPYIFSDTPLNARVTIISLSPTAEFEVEVDDEVIGQKIREKLVHYSEENYGQAVADKEHADLVARIDSILETAGITRDQLDRQQAVHTRETLQALMQLCAEVPHPQQGAVMGMFWRPVAKTDKAFVARWMVNFFAAERDPFERAQIGVNLDRFAIPEIADDLIRLIQDRRDDWSRVGLCAALLKTKDPRAPDVLASVLDDPRMTRSALEALGKLKTVSSGFRNRERWWGSFNTRRVCHNLRKFLHCGSP